MSSTTIAQLETAIQDLLARGPRTDDRDWCLTFAITGRDELWIQVTADMVNAAYPLEDEPAQGLAAAGLFPDHLELVDWDPGVGVTMNHSREGSALARYVHDYFAWLSGNPDSPLEAKIENLAC